MIGILVEKCVRCRKYESDLVDGLCVGCEDARLDMTNRDDHRLSIIDEDCYSTDECYDQDDFLNLENPCICGQDEIYSETLTDNLCLNCYQDKVEYRKWCNEFFYDN